MDANQKANMAKFANLNHRMDAFQKALVQSGHQFPYVRGQTNGSENTPQQLEIPMSKTHRMTILNNGSTSQASGLGVCGNQDCVDVRNWVCVEIGTVLMFGIGCVWKSGWAGNEDEGGGEEEEEGAMNKGIGMGGLLSFSAADLRDRDVLSKSDPMLVVYTKARDGAVVEVCRTEVVLNSLNPAWITKYTITYQFEIVQTLLFRVFDVDTQFHNVDVKILKLDEQQFLGEATCILSEIVTKSNRSLTLDLVCREECIPSTHPQHRGKLIVHAEECINSKTATEMTLRKVQKSLADLEKLHSSQQGEHMFLPTAIGHNYQSKLFVDNFSESIQYTFLDYLAGGFELNVMVAIDYTASNGNPSLPDSLHYLDPSGRPNAYQRVSNGSFISYKFYSEMDPCDHHSFPFQAILEVGEVLQFYDTDKRFPGARPIDGPVSHCFNLNGSSNYCEVEGL
ncbi:hypothetical protein LWI29_014652 [Acer saccharum]|uniref:C2 domain-containing protein n=1 Tax=Acer saccharum TaxID=4024 RepID=A0AA39SDZ8_ACESA|nr:hypothetical protein LWI29_014652 [Acer saccharum]